MAARVVWLVANGQVRPEQVLGLTFTRKAAGELADRIRRRLGQLAARGVLDAVLDADPTVLRRRARPCPPTTPSRAARRRTRAATRLRARRPAGHRGGGLAARHQGGRGVRRRRWTMSTHAPSTVAEQVLALHGELAGHLVEPARLADIAPQTSGRGRRAADGAAAMRGPYYQDVRDASAIAGRQSCSSLPLVERVPRRQAGARCIDFGDQAALAARLAARVPRGRRGRARAVPASCCSTSTRTPATPSWCCCARCSAAATRSPRSATRASRSTAGAAPAPAR